MKQSGTVPAGTPHRSSDGRPSVRGSIAAGLVFLAALVAASYPLIALGVGFGAVGTVVVQRVLRRVRRSRNPDPPGRSAVGPHRGRASPRQ